MFQLRDKKENGNKRIFIIILCWVCIVCISIILGSYGAESFFYYILFSNMLFRIYLKKLVSTDENIIGVSIIRKYKFHPVDLKLFCKSIAIVQLIKLLPFIIVSQIIIFYIEYLINAQITVFTFTPIFSLWYYIVRSQISMRNIIKST